jgi:lysophospholipase L1-like esterase
MKRAGIAIACLLVLFCGYRWLSPPSHAIRNAAPAGKTIVCFGDSLTYGTGAGKGMDYPAQLSALIGQPVINLGVPGDTTAGALARIDTVLAQEPRMVLLTLGGNDLKNRAPKAVAFSNLARIIRMIQDRGALVVIGGIDIPVYGRGFGTAYEDLAIETGSVLIPNVYADIMGHANLMSDPIHPNSDGYAILAGHFYKAIKPYLK